IIQAEQPPKPPEQRPKPRQGAPKPRALATERARPRKGARRRGASARPAVGAAGTDASSGVTVWAGATRAAAEPASPPGLPGRAGDPAGGLIADVVDVVGAAVALGLFDVAVALGLCVFADRDLLWITRDAATPLTRRAADPARRRPPRDSDVDIRRRHR
ncbi:hypothetical protein M885DRAFT_529708, partial [Pelagophyceae sp. CCMP2097]